MHNKIFHVLKGSLRLLGMNAVFSDFIQKALLSFKPRLHIPPSVLQNLVLQGQQGTVRRAGAVTLKSAFRSLRAYFLISAVLR